MKFPLNTSVEQVSFPDGGTRPNWKPFAFSPFYILPLSALHLLSIVGIQLLIKAHDKDADEIALAQSNRILDEPPSSLFVFEEDDVSTFMAWSYLPVAIAVILSIGWEALDAKLRRLEPFRQLASPQGGTAWNALCVDYTTLFGLFTPFQAIRRRHFTVALASTMYILSSIAVPAIANGIFSVEWGSLSFSSGRRDGTKYAAVTVNTGVALANQVLHGLLLAGGLVLTVMLLVRRSGLYHDPCSIGGLAALISDSVRSGAASARIFRQIPSYAHSRVVEKALGDIVFRLKHVQVPNANGTLSPTYQLTADVAPHTVLYIDSQDRRFYHHRRDASGYWLMKRAAWLAEAFLWLGQATVAGAIYGAAKLLGGVGGDSDGADKSRPMIGKIVLTVCITIGAMMWTSIERDIQLFAPWRSLSKPPERSLSNAIWRKDPVGQGQFGSAAFGLTRGHLVFVWAAFCVLMIQAVAVFIPPILELAWSSGVSGGQARHREIGILKGQKGLAPGGTGIALHIVVFLNLLAFTFSSLSRPFLPRAPTTVASEILYLCRSERLLRRFEASAMLSGREFDGMLKSAQGRCLFGWFWWREGGAWCVGIEEHEPGAPWHPFDFNRGIAGGQQSS